MLTQLQSQNFESTWDVIDHNHDGTIDEMDLAGSARSTCDALGLPPDSPERAAMMSSFSRFWERIRLAADADDDGRVSHAEYMDAASTMIQDDDYIEACVMVSDASFDAVDTDNDGSVSLDEVTRLYVSYGHDASLAAVAFAHVDTNDDGQVSRDEWRAAVVGIHLNESPDGMGSNMFGHAK
jgi:Ca2+-binding EF-hand superfamily protein